MCFIEHFIAHTYGTIKIDLIHAWHKSTANELLPQGRQWNTLYLIRAKVESAINERNVRPEMYYLLVASACSSTYGITLKAVLTAKPIHQLHIFEAQQRFIVGLAEQIARRALDKRLLNVNIVFISLQQLFIDSHKIAKFRQSARAIKRPTVRP